MDRRSFQQISRIRIQEASALLDAGFYSGAYYIAGYAVECALKACVAKQIKRYDIPDKKFVNIAYTHNLNELLNLAGLNSDFVRERNARPNLNLNWAIVKDWSSAARYEIGITEAQAHDLYSACTGRNGILPWIKRRW